VRPALAALEPIAGPVAVVGHSLGSGYAPLVAVQRPGSLLVHLCPRLGPFSPPPGAPDTFRKGVPFPIDGPDGVSAWNPDAAVDALYRRLPPATARAMAQRLRPLASIDLEYPLARHPDIPTVLVYAADDEILAPEWVRFMAAELLHVEPIEIPGGHFPMLENPDALAELLVRVAGERENAQSASA
jgi:pimeloyl-ACP methyl ester carboxylesterase